MLRECGFSTNLFSPIVQIFSRQLPKEILTNTADIPTFTCYNLCSTFAKQLAHEPMLCAMSKPELVIFSKPLKTKKMKNIIVVSFTDETKAIDALHKLSELDSFGDISIYEKIMVRKKTNGECEVLKEDSFEGWRTLTGMGIGSLLGILGGPVGFVIGLYTGTAIGAIADLGHYDFADDFIAKTKNKLAPGTVSIIAEIDEDSDAFVDASLKPFGAVITRSDVDFEFDNYVNEQIDKIEDDIAEERAALKKAIGNDKTKIQNKIAELKEKRKATIAEFLATAQATEKQH